MFEWWQCRVIINIKSVLESIVAYSPHVDPGGWFNKKIPSYQCRKSHCGDKTILRPSYLHNGISYTGKMTSLYWIRALVLGEIHMYISDYTAPILFQNIYNQHDSFISSHLFIGAHCQHFPIKQRMTIFINLISFLFTSTGLHSYKLKTIILMTMMPVMTIQLLVYACFHQLLTFYKKKDTIVVDLASSGGNGVYLRFFSYHTFSFSWQQSCNVLSFSDASIFVFGNHKLFVIESLVCLWNTNWWLAYICSTSLGYL